MADYIAATIMSNAAQQTGNLVRSLRVQGYTGPFLVLSPDDLADKIGALPGAVEFRQLPKWYETVLEGRLSVDGEANVLKAHVMMSRVAMIDLFEEGDRVIHLDGMDVLAFTDPNRWFGALEQREFIATREDGAADTGSRLTQLFPKEFAEHARRFEDQATPVIPINGGFLGFRVCDNVRRFFRLWKALAVSEVKTYHFWDQEILRIAHALAVGLDSEVWGPGTNFRANCPGEFTCEREPTGRPYLMCSEQGERLGVQPLQHIDLLHPLLGTEGPNAAYEKANQLVTECYEEQCPKPVGKQIDEFVDRSTFASTDSVLGFNQEGGGVFFPDLL